MKTKLKLITMLFMATALIAIASSCRTGYGCHGTGRTITGYKSSLGFGY